ncbi:MAG: hypothetical protein OEY79_00140 [Anaplasmataceae bacterium]|nr:hypothetical protein [Anaplasmataceae bacterium]
MEEKIINKDLEEQINFIVDKRFNINADKYERKDIADRQEDKILNAIEFSSVKIRNWILIGVGTSILIPIIKHYFGF